jgi:Protein of unknown function (DUF3102)
MRMVQLGRLGNYNRQGSVDIEPSDSGKRYQQATVEYEHMDKQAKGKPVDAVLEMKVAAQVRLAAERIHAKPTWTILDAIEVGRYLSTVKGAIPYGKYGRLIREEFNWDYRNAENYITVAERFGPLKEKPWILNIPRSAAYLLAAPSAPEQARQEAVSRARAGEYISPAIAREILARQKNKTGQKGGRTGASRRQKEAKAVPADRLSMRLARALDGWRQRWDPKSLSELARKLREFADSLDERGGGKTAKKR